MKKLSVIGMGLYAGLVSVSAVAAPSIPVSEPGTLALLTLGVAAAVAIVRKGRK